MAYYVRRPFPNELARFACSPVDETGEHAAGAGDNGSGAAPEQNLEEVVLALRAKVEQLQGELERVTEERDQQKDARLRVAADFDNFRKRQARDREQQAVAANERLVLDLLPVYDALELAVEAFDQHETDKVREGVQYVHRALHDVLARAGATAIDPQGDPFDPAEHEALMAQPDPEVDEGVVLQVHQRGFRLGERVIRPARVVISAGAREDE
jgi:molecular chaperone GrpE